MYVLLCAWHEYVCAYASTALVRLTAECHCSFRIAQRMPLRILMQILGDCSLCRTSRKSQQVAFAELGAISYVCVYVYSMIMKFSINLH